MWQVLVQGQQIAGGDLPGDVTPEDHMIPSPNQVGPNTPGPHQNPSRHRLVSEPAIHGVTDALDALVAATRHVAAPPAERVRVDGGLLHGNLASRSSSKGVCEARRSSESSEGV